MVYRRGVSVIKGSEYYQGITYYNPRRREFFFRVLFALVFLILAHLKMLGLDMGGDINYPALYILIFLFLLYSLATYFFYETLSLSGSLSWLVAAIDVFSLCGAVYISGGIQSYTYLFIGLIPLIGGIYRGYKGAIYACVLAIAGYTLVAFFDRSIPPGYDFAQVLALRYVFIIGSAILDMYIADLLLKDRRRLKILYEISQGSSKSPALYSVLKEVTQRMAEILSAEVVVVFLHNEESGTLEAQQPTLGMDYLSKAKLHIETKTPGVLQESFRERKPVLVSRSRAGLMDIEPFAPDYTILDLVVCPLLARGENIGLMVLANKLSRRGFNRRDLELTALLVPHITIFLENALLYRRSEEKVAQLTSLIRVVDAIGTVSNLEELYNLAMDVIKGLFAAEKVLINIINPHTELLENVRSLGYSEEYMQSYFRQPFEKMGGCYVLENDSAFLSRDINHDNHCPNLDVEVGIKSVLCVPIHSGQNVYGILHMASRYINAFDEEDAALAKAIGEQVGMAVESAQLFQEINRLAITDGLTGLYNIRHLKRVLVEEVKRSLRYKRPISFIMLDIDYFKYYNDSHGHPQGDQVLRILSGLLQQNTRDVDTVFRYGGEEFSVIIPEVAKQEAYSMAERIRRVIQDHVFSYEEEQPGGNLTVSMGVASIPEDALSGDELIDMADRALYRSKQTGRNRVCLYSTDLDASVVHGQGHFPEMEEDYRREARAPDWMYQEETDRESGS